MKRALSLFFCVYITFLLGCRNYNNPPSQLHEGDNAANYIRVFGEKSPAEVSVLNSVVVTYQWRLGVVTTDDFAFELLAPQEWIEQEVRKLRLFEGGGFASEFQRRKDSPARDWYAPKDLTKYVTYRDRTSVGYLHMLVEKTPEADGRYRVFISKH